MSSREAPLINTLQMSFAIFLPTTRCHQLSHTEIGTLDKGERKTQEARREKGNFSPRKTLIQNRPVPGRF